MSAVINPEIRVGPADDPPGAQDDIVSMKHCPHCLGRGYFFKNPFATGGGNGFGGRMNIRQCLTCQDCEKYWREHGTMPAGYEMPAES